MELTWNFYGNIQQGNIMDLTWKFYGNIQQGIIMEFTWKFGGKYTTVATQHNTQQYFI